MPADAELAVLLVFCVALLVPELDAEELSAAEFVFDALEFIAAFDEREPFLVSEAFELFEAEALVASDALELFDAVALVASDALELFDEESFVDSEAFALFDAELVAASESLAFFDEVAFVASEADLLALVVRDSFFVLLEVVARLFVFE